MKASLLILVLLLVLPFDIVSAQVGPGGFVPCEGAGCSACDFVSMANVIIKWLFGFMFLIFSVLMLTAGFGLVTSGGNQTALDSAKSKFQNALIGIIIALAAWVLVDTVMQGTLAGGGNLGVTFKGFGPWSEVKCQVQTIPDQVREGANTPDPAQAVITTPSASVPSGILAHIAAETMLAGKPISISSSGNCFDRTKASCTSLDGVKENTLNRIIELQEKANVPLVITGGTEIGHSNKGSYTHGSGYKIDLRTTPELNNYITANFTSIGGNKWKDANGNIYYRHGPVDHWDITITN